MPRKTVPITTGAPVKKMAVNDHEKYSAREIDARVLKVHWMIYPSAWPSAALSSPMWLKSVSVLHWLATDR